MVTWQRGQPRGGSAKRGVSQPGGGSCITMTRTQTWLHKAIPTSSRSAQKGLVEPEPLASSFAPSCLPTLDGRDTPQITCAKNHKTLEDDLGGATHLLKHCRLQHCFQISFNQLPQQERLPNPCIYQRQPDVSRATYHLSIHHVHSGMIIHRNHSRNVQFPASINYWNLDPSSWVGTHSQREV